MSLGFRRLSSTPCRRKGEWRHSSKHSDPWHYIRDGRQRFDSWHGQIKFPPSPPSDKIWFLTSLKSEWYHGSFFSCPLTITYSRY